MTSVFSNSLESVTKDLQKELEDIRPDEKMTVIKYKVLSSKANKLANAMETVVKTQNLQADDINQLLESELFLNQAVAKLESRDKDFFLIDKDSFFIVRKFQKLFARILSKERVKMNSPISWSKKNPRDKVHELYEQRFSAITGTSIKYDSSKAKQVRDIKFREDKALVDLLVERVGVRDVNSIRKYLSRVALTNEDYEKRKACIQKHTITNPLYFIVANKKEAFQFIPTAVIDLGAKVARGLKRAASYIPGLNRVVSVPEKKEPSDSSDETGFSLKGIDLKDGKIIETSKTIKIEPKTKKFFLEGAPQQQFTSLKELEVSINRQSGVELTEKEMVKEEKAQKLINDFQKKMKIPDGHPQDNPSENKYSCYLDNDNGKFFIKMKRKGVKEDINIEVQYNEQANTLTVNNKIIWPQVEVKNIKAILIEAIGAFAQPNIDQNILLTISEVEADYSSGSQFKSFIQELVPGAMSAKDFEANCAKFSGTKLLPGAYTLFIQNEGKRKCQIQYVDENEQIQSFNIIFLEQRKIQFEGKTYETISSVLENKSINATKQITPAQLRKIVDDRRSFIMQIEQSEEFKPYTDQLAQVAVFKNVLDVEPWFLAREKNEERPEKLGWIGSCVTATYRYITGAQRSWDFVVKKGASPKKLILVLDDKNCLKFKLDGDDENLYDSVQELTNAFMQDSANLRFSAVNEVFLEVKQKIEKSKPLDSQYGDSFFTGSVNAAGKEAIKQKLQEMAQKLPKPVGCIVFDEDNKNYLFICANKVIVSENQIKFNPEEEEFIVSEKTGKDITGKDINKLLAKADGIYTLAKSAEIFAIQEQNKAQFNRTFLGVFNVESEEKGSTCLTEIQKKLPFAGDEPFMYSYVDQNCTFVTLCSRSGKKECYKIEFDMEKIKISKKIGDNAWELTRLTDQELLNKCEGAFAYMPPSETATVLQASTEKQEAKAPSAASLAASATSVAPASIKSNIPFPEWLENDDANAPPTESVKKFVNSLSIKAVQEGKTINSLRRTTGPAAVEKRYRSWIRGLCGSISKEALISSMKEATKNLRAIDRLWLLEVCVQETQVTESKEATFNFICETLEESLLPSDRDLLDAFVRENSSHYGDAKNLKEAIEHLRGSL